MWYIIKTDYYKEREAIKDLLQLDGITDIYFPNPRPKLPEIGREEESTVSFRPVINGILFAYVTEPKLLRNDLNASGYFLRKEKTANIGGVNLTTDANGASVNRRRMQVAGNAHLFSQEGEPGNLESLLLHAQVSDEEIYRYKVCVEQCAAHTDDIKIVDKDYAELAAKNDLVMITDGPLVGYTGVIKQVKTDGVKDRCFFFSLGGFCVRLSGSAGMESSWCVSLPREPRRSCLTPGVTSTSCRASCRLLISPTTPPLPCVTSWSNIIR